jgi:hypothetical protein
MSGHKWERLMTSRQKDKKYYDPSDDNEWSEEKANRVVGFWVLALLVVGWAYVINLFVNHLPERVVKPYVDPEVQFDSEEDREDARIMEKYGYTPAEMQKIRQAWNDSIEEYERSNP